MIKETLVSLGVPVFPCWDNKTPAITAGFKGASLNVAEFQWPSELVGVPIPPGTIVIDIDAYKGMTTDLIDGALGCKLDWVNSFLQFTPAGGSHHAFQDTNQLRQGADIFWQIIGKGFDTRVTGRGYICTGGSYGTTDAIGVLKLASAEGLPTLPPEAIAALSAAAEDAHEPIALPTGNRDAEEIRKMLKCLDADCGRDDWRAVAYGLKHHYHDDDGTGWILFDNWSKTGGEAYDPVDVLKLWSTIDPTRKDGGRPITLATLAGRAIEKGYIPDRNAESVFGGTVGPASALPDMEVLIDKINSEGGKPEALDHLTTEIRGFACSTIQRAALVAALHRSLTDHGLKGITLKDLKQAVAPAQFTMPTVPQVVNQITRFHEIEVAAIPALGNVHIQNAQVLRQALFGDRLVRYGADPWWWSGRQWEAVGKHELNSKIAHAFIGSEYGKTGNIDGSDKQLRNMIINNGELSPASTLIFFKNGVVDVNSGHPMTPHSPEHKNATTLAVEYHGGDGASPPEWSTFLESIFHTEPERITFLQELMGWFLISDNLNHQKAVAFDGVSRAGKGIILGIVSNILGQSSIDLSLGQLADNKVLSTLRTATIAMDRDAKTPQRTEITTVHSVFNKMTANEPLSIPLLYNQEPWAGKMNCKLVIGCNGIPIMADDSGAAPGRWLVLKFTESFIGRLDLTLEKRLMTELSEIASWSVIGLQRLISNGAFTLPASSIEESLSLIESSSPLVQFAAERLELDPGHKVHTSQLWESFKRWCDETNNRYPTRQQFVKSLERTLGAQGVKPVRSLRINNAVSTGFTGVQLAQCAAGVTPIRKPEVFAATAPPPPQQQGDNHDK